MGQSSFVSRDLSLVVGRVMVPGLQISGFVELGDIWSQFWGFYWTERIRIWIFILGMSMWWRRWEHSPSTADCKGVDIGLISFITLNYIATLLKDRVG